MKIDLEIMDLFKELEEVIENAPLKGLARKSISLDKEEVLAIISDIKALMPEEVNQAIWINRERQRIITEAKAEAEQIIAQANQEAQIKAKEGEQFEENLKQQFDDIVESNEVVERAKERASEIINRAEAYAIEIREGSLEYAEDVISSVEHNLIEILEIVKRNKRELREETGCTTDKIIEQPAIYAQPEFTNERLGSFVALDCEQTEKQHLDADETVCVFKLPYEGAIQLVKNNVIKDERTIIALGISRCIQGLRFGVLGENIEEFTKKVINRLKDEEENLEEKEVGIDYTLPCEFGLVRDHIVVVPGNKNSRRECFYLKSGSIVLPISKNGKLGFGVRYMPAVDKNLVHLPEKLEFKETDNLCESVPIQRIFNSFSDDVSHSRHSEIVRVAAVHGAGIAPFALE